jgi:hypothetical protein
MINFCKYAKYAGLTTGLLSAGLAFKSDDENFAKSTSSLALINGLIGIGSEGIKELILEPQKKKLQDGERRGLRENLEENNQSVSSFDTYQTAPELQEIIVENQAQIETSLRQRV